jgi:hypothetical protein
MLCVTGFAIICSLFTVKYWNPFLFHSLLIFGISAPAGSIGYDVGHTRRSMFKYASASLGIVVVFFVIPGLLFTWNDVSSASGCIGNESGRTIRFQYSDQNYYDGWYSLVLYTDKSSDNIRTFNRLVILPEYSVAFPPGYDVALVNVKGGVRFCNIPDVCFIKEEATAAMYFLFLRYPSYRVHDHEMRTRIDVEKLKRTAVWKKVIYPFLTGSDGRDEP